MHSLAERLRHWRQEIARLSLREMQEAVNAHLPEGDRVSLGTVSNYERVPEAGGRRAGPRAEYVSALKRAFPELRLPWLLLGEGRPTELAERVGGDGDLERAADGRGKDGLAARILERYPDLELLPPEASALFTGALTRWVMGAPEADLDEEHLLELAGDLRWLLLLPYRLWGFDPSPDYESFSAYSVALLHALMLAMPSPGGGEAADRYGAYPNRGLRRRLRVGFGDAADARAAGTGAEAEKGRAETANGGRPVGR